MYYRGKPVKIFLGEIYMTSSIQGLYYKEPEFKEFVDSMLLLYENCNPGDVSIEDIEQHETEIKECLKRKQYFYGEGIYYVYPRYSFYGYYRMTGQIRAIVQRHGYEEKAIWIQTDYYYMDGVYTTICFPSER